MFFIALGQNLNYFSRQKLFLFNSSYFQLSLLDPGEDEEFQSGFKSHHGTETAL